MILRVPPQCIGLAYVAIGYAYSGIRHKDYDRRPWPIIESVGVAPGRVICRPIAGEHPHESFSRCSDNGTIGRPGLRPGSCAEIRGRGSGKVLATDPK